MSGEWRCGRCGKLLGLISGARLHIASARGHDYMVSLPVSGTCRGCGTRSELSDPEAHDALHAGNGERAPWAESR